MNKYKNGTLQGVPTRIHPIGALNRKRMRNAS